MKTIGIVGSRRRNTPQDYEAVHKALVAILEDGDHIVSGGCPQGGDQFAEVLARRLQIPITIYHAQWNKHGKAAGFIRNGEIATKADVLIACVASDRTGGTEDTLRKFGDKGQVVLV